MARMLSQVATLLRGSIGGVTYFANQFHPILMRARVAPVQPDTQNQSRIRTAMSYASTQWRIALEADRIAWDDYAQTLVYQGPAGGYTLPGRQVMIGNISLMRYLLSRGIAFTTSEVTHPSNPGFLGIDNVNITAPAAPGTGFDVAVTHNNIEPCKAVLQRSVPFQVTRNNYKGPYDSSTLQAVTCPIGTPTTISFTGLIAGMRYFFTLRLIVDDGPKRLSQLFHYSAVAQTTV